MNTEQLIRKIKDVFCDYYQSYSSNGEKYLGQIHSLIETYELEKRIEEGKERVFVARFPKLNYLIALTETQFQKKPQEWTEKTPFDVEIKVNYRMFRYEADFDIKKFRLITEKLNKNEELSSEEKYFIEKAIKDE